MQRIGTIILAHSPVATKFQWKMIEKNLKQVQPDLGFVWEKVLFCSTKPKFSFVDNNYCPFHKEKISFEALKWNNIILDCHCTCLKKTKDKVYEKKLLMMSINNAALSFFQIQIMSGPVPTFEMKTGFL